jgi:hypothetical protein
MMISGDDLSISLFPPPKAETDKTPATNERAGLLVCHGAIAFGVD